MSSERLHVLTPILLGLTAVTGLIDAVSYLALGHVFTANMTGNVVFLGFAAAGAPGLSVSRSAAALVAFLAGAAIGGGLVVRMESGPRHRWTGVAFGAQAALLLAATLVCVGAPGGRAAGRCGSPLRRDRPHGPRHGPAQRNGAQAGDA